MPTSSRTTKAKITVTLSPDLVRQLDALTQTPKGRSRSQLVEEALRQWLQERLRIAVGIARCYTFFAMRRRKPHGDKEGFQRRDFNQGEDDDC